MTEVERQVERLAARLDACMLSDQPRLRRRLRAARRDGSSTLEQIGEAIERSAAVREQRRRSVPNVTFPQDLPIATHRGAIAEAIGGHQVVVVCGETGSGKTTQLPKICLELGRGVGGAIGLTQPRRIAARSVSVRIAQELGGALGGIVGYQVRFDDRVGPDCLVKIMTDGILLAETRSDRQLRRYDTLILDEAHERTLNIDFLLGYLKRLLPRRPELRLIIASATIDPQRFAAHFWDAPIVEVSGRTYPVEVRYRPPADDEPDGQDRAMIEGIVDAVDELETEGPGDVLVFLSGEREIRETAKALRRRPGGGTEILPLYARLPTAEQARIFAPHAGRRVVLATNVAETSLTVPGIRYVVDTGLARVSRYSPRRRVQRLPIEAISKASAAQRAGRCGRVADGICIRLCAEKDWERRDEHTAPELLRSNLAGVVLQMKSLELGDVGAFPWLDPPRVALIRDAQETLHELDAIDDRQRLTPIGRRLARLPVDPRLGRMLLAAGEETCLDEVLIIAAALAVQDPRVRPMDGREEADRAHRRFDHPGSDILTLVNLWRFYREQRLKLTWSKLREQCTRCHLSLARLLEWHEVHRQLKRLVLEAGLRINTEPAEATAIHRAVLTGLLSNVGRRGDRGVYDGARGSAFRIFPGSVLGVSRSTPAELDEDDDADRPSEQPRPAAPSWVMAAEIVETTRRYARGVAPVEPEWIEQAAAHLVRRSHARPHWDRRSGRVLATERVTLYGLELIADRRVDYAEVDRDAAREIFIRDALVRGRARGRREFLRHNIELVAAVEAMEARARRRDLLVDESRLHAFYDTRLPADVCSVATLDRWHRRAVKSDPELLQMAWADVVRDDAATLDPGRFPDRLRVGGAVVPLTYRHEPGDPADGVTASVPLAAVSQIDAAALGWLVPGMLGEKIVALIRSLPKSIRRNFVPVAEFAEACRRTLERERGSRPLTRALGETLHAMTGVEVPPDAWTEQSLPPHLSIRLEVVDESGAVVEQGRDPAAIRVALAPHARASFEQMHGAAFHQDGITGWSLGDLPAVVELGDGLVGYPTLLDRGSSVSLRLVGDAGHAYVAGRAGLRRLLAMQIPDDLDAHLSHLPQLEMMERLFTTLGDHAALHDGLSLQLVERAFMATDAAASVRSEDAFRSLLDRGRDELWSIGLAVGELVERILQRRHQVELALLDPCPEHWRGAVDDMRRHLADLTPADFLAVTDAGWLEHLPRYIEGIGRRHAKLVDGGHERDATQMARIDPLRRRCHERRVADAGQSVHDPQLEHYRWMLEEFAVSLFAQELRTALPVSEKRLAEQWDRVGRR